METKLGAWTQHCCYLWQKPRDGFRGKGVEYFFKGLLWLGKFQSVQIRWVSRCLPVVSSKKMLFLFLNPSLPSLTALTFTPGALSSPGHLFQGFLIPSLHCFAHHSLPATPRRKTPLLWNQELALEENSTEQPEGCGRWPAGGCHGNSWISFIPLTLLPCWLH